MRGCKQPLKKGLQIGLVLQNTYFSCWKITSCKWNVLSDVSASDIQAGRYHCWLCLMVGCVSARSACVSSSSFEISLCEAWFTMCLVEANCNACNSIFQVILSLNSQFLTTVLLEESCYWSSVLSSALSLQRTAVEEALSDFCWPSFSFQVPIIAGFNFLETYVLSVFREQPQCVQWEGRLNPCLLTGCFISVQ